MADPEWLVLYNWAGYFAYPVDVLSRGKKFATVRLRHQTRIGREKLAAGTIKRRVPLHAITPQPASVAYVSQGGGRFK